MNKMQLADEAFDILKKWSWGFIDPDGFIIDRSFEISDVMNRLAFNGCEDPVKAILALLCEGRLRATGDYEWLYFRHYQRYKLSGTKTDINKEKWQKLRKLTGEIRYGGAEEDWDTIKVDLNQLELNGLETAVWEPQYNRASFATYTRGVKDYWDNYFEEWFSITNIEISLSEEEISLLREGSTDENNADVLTEQTNQTLSPLAESELNKWWTSKENVRDLLSKDELLALVRQKFPDKHITRDRIRELAGPRKRGPKQISGKTPAK